MKFQALFGPAATILQRLTAKIQRADFAAEGPHKLLFVGPAGIGKSQVANALAEQLDPGHFCTVRINGKELTIDEVRYWRKHMKTVPMGSRHYVTIIDELDRSSRDAQDLMLSWLDGMASFGVVIATTNLDLDSLQERLHTRFQQIQFDPPSDQQIYQELVKAGIEKQSAKKIAEGAKGNVRAAELDATTWKDFEVPA